MTRVLPFSARLGPIRLGPALIGVAIAALAGCGEGAVRISTSSGDSEAKGVLKVIDALQCPETVGVLARKGSAQAGGDICTYAGPRGAEVALHLVRLDGRAPEAVLADFERRVGADLAQALARIGAPETEPASVSQDGGPAAEVVTDGDRASVHMPGLSVETRGEDASVRLPGLSIETQGDRASVRIGGVRIGADSSGGGTRVETGSVQVRARDNAAEVRRQSPGAAVRSTYVLTDDAPSPEGWRLAGFVARGPAGGPIVIATVRAKEQRERELFDAAGELVTQNVGR